VIGPDCANLKDELFDFLHLQNLFQVGAVYLQDSNLMTFSLEEDLLISDESLMLINSKLKESEKFNTFRIVERGSDEHLAALHVSTPSEVSDASNADEN